MGRLERARRRWGSARVAEAQEAQEWVGMGKRRARARLGVTERQRWLEREIAALPVPSGAPPWMLKWRGSCAAA